MAKRATAKVKRELGERIWATLWVHGFNGVRKGATIWKVVTLDGIPMMVNRGHVPKMAVRSMRDEDFVDQEMAIDVLESILDTLRIDQEMDEAMGCEVRGTKSLSR